MIIVSKITNEHHDGNTQDEYNKITSGYPSDKLKDEADYILEQNEKDGYYLVTKSPEGDVVESTTQPYHFAADHEKVLIIHYAGTYERFNFKFADQFPTQE